MRGAALALHEKSTFDGWTTGPRRTARRTTRHGVQGMYESRGLLGHVADDSHARDHCIGAPSEVGAVGPRVEVLALFVPQARIMLG